MFKFRCYFFVLLSGIFLSSQAFGEWQIVWEDNFEKLDHTRWQFSMGNGQVEDNPGWGNDELQCYTSKNAYVNRGGYLIMTAKRAHTPIDMGPGVGACDYTSAKLVTRDSIDFQYGKIEARILFPSAQGLAPAFRMLAYHQPHGVWPYHGGIDIAAIVSQSLSQYSVRGNLHFAVDGSTPANLDCTVLNTPSCQIPGSVNDVRRRFHTYAIRWTPQHIAWLLDGAEYHRVEMSETQVGPYQPVNHSGQIVNPFRKDAVNNPFYLMLNLAIFPPGNGLVGDPSETRFFQKMYVDWVRVSQWNGGNGEFRQQTATSPVALCADIDCETVISINDFDNGGEQISEFYTVDNTAKDLFRFGAWREFTVDVRESGCYQISPTMNASSDGEKFQLVVDAQSYTPSIYHDGNMASGQPGVVCLTGGVHVLRYLSVGGDYSLSTFSLKRLNSYEANIISFRDGDSLLVRNPKTRRYARAELFGIEAPELREDWAAVSMARLALNRQFRRQDVFVILRDSYAGSDLVDIWVPNYHALWLNKFIVDAGYAVFNGDGGDDAPPDVHAPKVRIGQASYSATTGEVLDLSGALSLSDDDGDDGHTIKATVEVSEGEISASVAHTGVNVQHIHAGKLEMTGTLTQINALLADNGQGSIRYQHSVPGAFILTFGVSDTRYPASPPEIYTNSDTAVIEVVAIDTKVFVSVDRGQCSFEGSVNQVFDGDTLQINGSLFNKNNVRLWHIDTPESSAVAPKFTQQDFYQEAKERLIDLVSGKTICLQDTQDSSGSRFFGTVYVLGDSNPQTVDDIDVGKTLVHEGLAWENPFVLFNPNRYDNPSLAYRYNTLRYTAEQAGRGLWSTDIDYAADRPSCHRESSICPVLNDLYQSWLDGGRPAE